MLGLKEIALIITSVGGLNWGLIGIADFNLVDFVFGFSPILVSIIYIIVGISACYTLYAYLTE